MRAVSLLLLVPMIVVLVGCAAASGDTLCKPPANLGCCTGSETGTPKPVPYVVTMDHSEALRTLREAGFTNVCCDGDNSHQNHYANGTVLWQKCIEPDTLHVDNVVYLCFDPKHNGHP